MKALVFNMLTIAATFAAMTACTSESDPVDEVNPKDAKVEIKLNAGVGSITTKAAIESDADGKPTSEVANVFLYKQESDAESVDWSTATELTPIKVKIPTDGTIDFDSNIQYYPVNNNKVHFVGVYTGLSTDPKLETGNVMPITITGAEDILYASSVNVGTRLAPGTQKISFKHKLTQIKFTLQKAAGVADNIQITTMKITKASKADIHNTCNMNLATGELTTWAGSITEGIIINNTPSTALTETASTATEGVMLEPDITSITVEVSSSAFPNNTLTATIPGVSSGKFSAGTAYTIALTVKAQSISGNASINDWTEASGSADI
ncbi:fimbrillin family protein [Parabacteroides chongii]|uniref:fimbrillin family protein n=1 Tax=Parabacteroides chongii TaxID=2685834 RepID=UPI00240D98E6|nr:fimbrillin family protein [Parabacteroides chongii]WFE85748.1 fimbrillin family protein [Parabacteroides chongii]